MNNQAEIIPAQNIAQRIRCIRDQKVILDSDLADLYGVPTKQLNQQLQRNRGKFPDDFAFQLTGAEWEALRSHFVTLKAGRGQHRKYLPYVFTEYGALAGSQRLEQREGSGHEYLHHPRLRQNARGPRRQCRHSQAPGRN
jgi:hypothetical protein